MSDTQSNAPGQVQPVVVPEQLPLFYGVGYASRYDDDCPWPMGTEEAGWWRQGRSEAYANRHNAAGQGAAKPYPEPAGSQSELGGK
jgi:hypothetical protein